jgi:hypothetical protein
MPQLFLRRKNRVSSRRLGMGQESHLYLLLFACQRTLSYRSPYVLREYVHMGGTP